MPTQQQINASQAYAGNVSDFGGSGARTQGGYPGDPRGRAPKPPGTRTTTAPTTPSFGKPTGRNRATISTGKLSFPSNLGTDPTQMNMMMFTIKEITGGRADARNIQFKTMADAPVICVPIPSGLTSSNQQAWGRADITGATAHMVGSQTGQSLISGIADVIRTSGSKFAGTQGDPALGGSATGSDISTGQAIQNTLGAVAGNLGPVALVFVVVVFAVVIIVFKTYC